MKDSGGCQSGTMGNSVAGTAGALIGVCIQEPQPWYPARSDWAVLLSH
jgi:hypothetical protein